jgi:nucleoside-diphosphate-sugar epimerase
LQLTEAFYPSFPAIKPGTTIAVTGATGFIGGRLVQCLAQQGGEITCLIRGMDAGMRLHRAGARIRQLDMADAEAVRTALEGIEIVFHLAYDWDDAAWNHKALQALIGACSSNSRRLVYVSSFVVYAVPDHGEVSEDSPSTTATGGYAHTKLQLEAQLLKAVREQGVAGTIVQPTIVYGPFSRFWTIDPVDMLRHGTVILPGSGEGICNAVYVDDVVSAMILAAQRSEAVGQRYLISGPAPITWRDFYEGMAQAIGTKGPQYRPAEVIAQASGKVGKLLRLAADPELGIRLIANIGPTRKLVKASLGVLPRGLRSNVASRLYGSIARRRGHVHMPNRGHLNFLQSRSTINSAKAKEELGYAPAISFAEGMVPTAQYLKEIYFASSPYGICHSTA